MQQIGVLTEANGRKDAVIAALNEERLALVMLGGVNYLTGQVLDMAAIAAHTQQLNAAAQARGAPRVPLGLDLAHAVGNVPLSLHAWGVDFAAWCTYAGSGREPIDEQTSVRRACSASWAPRVPRHAGTST